MHPYICIRIAPRIYFIYSRFNETFAHIRESLIEFCLAMMYAQLIN